MARIRTIKPEFWTSEQVMECDPLARLLFIGIWNFCDDAGNHPMSEKTLKALVFPADDIDSTTIRRLIDDLSSNGLITLYTHSGKVYLHVNGWHHQKIEKPSVKHPAFRLVASGSIEFDEGMRPVAHVVDDHSTTNRRPVVDGREGKGKGKEEQTNQKLLSPPDGDDTPSPKITYVKISEIYNRVCGEVLPKCEALNTKRKTNIRNLCALKIRGGHPFRDPDFWEGYFNDCLTNPHWIGQNERGWRADLEFLTRTDNALKVLEAV